jgi:Bacterial SH3 domain
MRPRMADSPLIVQMPKPAEDRPSWTKVGVITAIGFLVGVLWPRLAGVRMGPAVPEAAPVSVVAAPASASAAGAAVLPVAIVASAPPLVLAPGDGTPPRSTTPPSADVQSAPQERGAAADTAAQVVWAVALVRDVPKTGKVVARLPRGVAVRVGAMKDGWLPVKYGDGFSNEGWVYRGAIGK